jgi:two-component system, OmpR family, sensor kinase
MRLRRRLVVTMIVLVALGLGAVDVITFSALHSYLYGRVDDQLTTVTDQTAAFLQRAEMRGLAITPDVIANRVSPDLYVEIIGLHGTSVIRPSGPESRPDPAPKLPVPLRTRAAGGSTNAFLNSRGTYHPSPASIDVPSVVPRGPEYRLQATVLPGRTLVVASNLDGVNSTLASLRTIELAVSLGLLAALLVLMTVLVRLGLRPLEDMARQADAIADGDLTRRVKPDDGDGEIARLGRALNGMLEQIETAFAQRTRSEERLRSFLADASHELRTPLTSIRGYAELLQKDALGDLEARDRALSRIEKEAARMGVLVGDLSILAREGEGPEPILERVDLAAVAADVVADARALDTGRTVDLRAPTEVAVAGDEARLEQMVHNLIGNALAHTPPGTPVEVRVSACGPEAVLEVQDHGPGMGAEEASRVFDRFYRGRADRLDGGSGLGLFIVASLARTFGGQASVDTAQGRGATFRVALPRWEDRPQAPGQVARPVTGEPRVGEPRAGEPRAGARVSR